MTDYIPDCDEPEWDSSHSLESQVQPEDDCPKCGESRSDFLVWDEDGVEVTCQTCKTKYVPATRPQED